MKDTATKAFGNLTARERKLLVADWIEDHIDGVPYAILFLVCAIVMTALAGVQGLAIIGAELAVGAICLVTTLGLYNLAEKWKGAN